MCVYFIVDNRWLLVVVICYYAFAKDYDIMVGGANDLYWR